jgi:hypothetical protein
LLNRLSLHFLTIQLTWTTSISADPVTVDC